MRLLISCLLFLPACGSRCGGGAAGDGGSDRDTPPNDVRGDREAADLFMTLGWSSDCVTGCSASPDRTAMHLNGENGWVYSCELFAQASTYRLTFAADHNPVPTVDEAEYGIEFRSLSFPTTGGPARAGCLFRLLEGGNEYEGNCGGEAPGTPNQPCQVSDVHVGPNENGQTAILGTFRCENLIAPAAPPPDLPLRVVEGPAGALTARFEIQGCGP